MQTTHSILSIIESERVRLIESMEPAGKALNGQFMTPAPIARAMAGFFAPLPNDSEIRLLDPGAGTGSLAFAFLERIVREGYAGQSVHVVCYETDPVLASHLRENVEAASTEARSYTWDLTFELHEEDFMSAAISELKPNFLSSSSDHSPFTHVIMNPPYRKLAATSGQRAALDGVGIRANNLYSAFVALSLALLEDGGELVAITPRSFCNGPYFRPFRKLVLGQGSFSHIHVFEARDRAFKEDKVLQENVIFHFVKGNSQKGVEVSTSPGRDFSVTSSRRVPHSRVVNPRDPELIVHIPANELDDYVLERISSLTTRLSDLRLGVSTGPVVDFRLRHSIRHQLNESSVPLIYPSHVLDQAVQWPRQRGKKPIAIQVNNTTSKWLLPNDNYVLIRRFSSKEEKRRIYPALLHSLDPGYEFIGIENHLNVIHGANSRLGLKLAKGLVAYFSSTIVDLYFRQFSGHTQVNASDLRTMPLPSRDSLIDLGAFYAGDRVDADGVDAYLETLFLRHFRISSPDPVKLFKG